MSTEQFMERWKEFQKLHPGVDPVLFVGAVLSEILRSIGQSIRERR